MTKTAARARAKKLREEINRHRYLYHVLDKQEISDAALDSLKAELASLEEQWPLLVTPDSPTQRVGGAPASQFAQVEHRSRMLSLGDIFSPADLSAWAARNKKIVAQASDYFCELKIDGVAISLIYEESHLVRAATRGDGAVGEDVTHNIKTIEAIPLRLNSLRRGRVEVRGEVYLAKKDFAAINKEQAKSGLRLYANPRNLAAGSIRQLDPKVAAARPLKFFAWEITEAGRAKTRAEEYQELQDLGCPVPPDAALESTLDAVAAYLKKIEARKGSYPFLVDGAVIKINDLALAARLGVVGKAPRASIAYKFAAPEATTIVEDIIVQVGRTGVLTPVAILRPVSVAGTRVSRATLHNADEIARKDVRVGDTVIVRKAGDIIPEVVAVLPALRPAASKPYIAPARCPICKSRVIKDATAVANRCSNPSCFTVQRERIFHAVGPLGFDIEGLGEKIIEQLLQEGLIEDAADLWQLTPGDLTPLEHFATLKADKIVKQIQASKTITLSRFLVALSIPHVGVVTAQDISREFKNLSRLQRGSLAHLCSLDGIGDIVAPSIFKFFRQAGAKKLLRKYKSAGITIVSDTSQGPLQDKTFLFTGALDGMTRAEAKQRVLALGGKIVSAVSKQLDYLIVGEDPGSKTVWAEQLGITQLNADQFRELLQHSPPSSKV